jgi:hypothetical protein
MSNYSSQSENGANGDAHAGPSTSPGYTNGHAISIAQQHDQTIINYLYDVGFQTGQFADTVMHAHQYTYRLHAILLARSPYLHHLLTANAFNGGERAIYVPLEREPEITPEGFAIALGYLYSSTALEKIHIGNARAALAAGCLLGGMPEFCEHAYDACRQAISPETVHQWLDFVAVAAGVGSANGSQPGSGVSTPITPTGNAPPPPPPPSVFGIYAERLREDVFSFLVSTLPVQLGVTPTPTSQLPGGEAGKQALLDIFVRMPFELFKMAVESPDFRIGSDQARFKFAKDAIDLRKKTVQGSGAEETVVLAFGGSSTGGSAVHVTRKMRKRPLWKVNA